MDFNIGGYKSTRTPITIRLCSSFRTCVTFPFLSILVRDTFEVSYKCAHSARVVHSTSYSDVTSRGRPDMGPYVGFRDVLLRPGVWSSSRRLWTSCRVGETRKGRIVAVLRIRCTEEHREKTASREANNLLEFSV